MPAGKGGAGTAANGFCISLPTLSDGASAGASLAAPFGAGAGVACWALRPVQQNIAASAKPARWIPKFSNRFIVSPLRFSSINLHAVYFDQHFQHDLDLGPLRVIRIVREIENV